MASLAVTILTSNVNAQILGLCVAILGKGKNRLTGNIGVLKL